MTPEAVAAELHEAHAAGGTFPELIERVSRGLLFAPYLLSPLGEGAPPDPDPRFRLDAFDCTTLVETAIALAREEDLGAAQAALDRIRYTGPRPLFEERRHLMTSQWVPGLIEADIVEDVTASVGGDETRRIRLVLTEARWKKRRIARALALGAGQVPTGTFELSYVPIASLVGRTDAVPAGVVLNVVREDVPWSPEVITHQALIVTRPRDQARIARHASPVSKRVIDEPLEHMLARYSKPNGWPILGVNLLRVIEPKATPRPARE